ncbi:MAG: universal stress protein, partial [Hyphomicrobiales bacterium]|nr:universal stress protein [Hyphomicrobiales bacterium]
KDIADVLLRHAIDKNADLIVMGGYGHSYLQEWLLGGTTRDLLSKTEFPVLLVH